jgi:general secretion pathway protein A
MYTNYFSLKQPPFSIAPDPHYLYMSERHREALAHLLYGVDSGGGFVLLTGEIGAGKTTVCRCFLEQVPAHCRLGYIFNPKLSVEELLVSICEEFSIDAPRSAATVKTWFDAINRHLLDCHARGQNNVLVIDEAQNLSVEVLEQLRLLTNLETSERKLLQIILIGQPELRTMLARPELEQLAQRVIARYHLGPLSEDETAAYIAHRMAVAGSQGGEVFPAGLTGTIHRLTGGVPRRINLLCDRALLGAYVENSRIVTRQILRRSAEEVFDQHKAPSQRRALALGGVCAAVALSAAAWHLNGEEFVAAPVAAKKMIAKPVPMPGPVAAPLKPALDGLPAQGADAAMKELALLWHATLPEGDCAAVTRFGLRCHSGRGGLYELRQIDRPAVIALRDGANVTHVVLHSLDGDGAILTAGASRVRVPLAQLLERFDGEYTTLWKGSSAFREQLERGDRGDDVDWLAIQLAAQANASPPRPGTPLDGDTLRHLRDFQDKYKLKADGVAGPRTYMRLNQLNGVVEPRLLAKAGQ